MGNRDIDWTPIEADYRIGKMSGMAIAKKHGIAYSGLRRKAKIEGWTQDLTSAVQAATRAELTKQAKDRAAEARKEQAAAASIGEEVAVITSAIGAAVAENVKVINRHRSMADALMNLVGSLADEVKALTDNETNPVAKITSLGDRVDAVRKLSQTVATVVDVERKAHNLDQQVSTTDVDDLVKTLQGSSLPIVQIDPESADR